MVGLLGAATALAGVAIILDTDGDHDDVVQKTADKLESKLSEHATLYADHLDGDYPNPRRAFLVNDCTDSNAGFSERIFRQRTGSNDSQNTNENKKEIRRFMRTHECALCTKRTNSGQPFETISMGPTSSPRLRISITR
jgi:hypothetical protein